jgi:hypothetical protein
VEPRGAPRHALAGAVPQRSRACVLLSRGQSYSIDDSLTYLDVSPHFRGPPDRPSNSAAAALELPAVPTGALLVPAAGSMPSYCLVTGLVDTNPSTGKTANVGLALPLIWTHKFLFSGCGGYCGVVFQSLPDDARGGGSPPRCPREGLRHRRGDD